MHEAVPSAEIITLYLRNFVDDTEFFCAESTKFMTWRNKSGRQGKIRACGAQAHAHAHGHGWLRQLTRRVLPLRA
jgi:hypothetical protein